MTYTSLLDDLKPVALPLEHVFLDPNNPRFTGSEWEYISEDDIALPQVQDTTRLRLVKDFGINKLRLNMEVNGYLPIDRVVVREFSPDKYVVLEGNRRICAAKMISQYADSGERVSPRVLGSLEKIPCLQYTGTEEDASWILQGLRHISGIADWSSFNKAKLLVEQKEKDELSLTDVGKRFGLTPHGAGQWMRGFYAFRQAQESSDYVSEVDERIYPYLQELFSRSSIAVREWMEWDDSAYGFANDLHFNEFLSWFYPRPEDASGEEREEAMGEWDQRVVRTQDDIRQIAELISSDQQSFHKFRRELDLEDAYGALVVKKQEVTAKSQRNPAEDTYEAIRECTTALENLPLIILRDDKRRSQLVEALGLLRAAIDGVEESLPNE